MRNYKATIPNVRHPKINQPPFDGDGWPQVVGTPLAQLARRTSGIAGVSLGGINYQQAFGIYTSASALSFMLGRAWKPLYVGSVLFGLLAAYNAFKTLRQ